MASHNAVLKLESKSKLRQVSNSAQTQHFSSLELLLDSYMPEMALSSKYRTGQPTTHRDPPSSSNSPIHSSHLMYSNERPAASPRLTDLVHSTRPSSIPHLRRLFALRP